MCLNRKEVFGCVKQSLKYPRLDCWGIFLLMLMVLYVNIFYKNLSYICATLFQKWVYTNQKVWYNKGTERR